jgi:hypothetical protein
MTNAAPPQPMTAEDVVRRIASECAFVDPHGGVGIRLKSAAAIVRQYADQFRAEPRVAHPPRRPPAQRVARQAVLLLPVAGGGRKTDGPE